MENTQTILDNHSNEEKTAYLAAIASLATADWQASDEEINSLTLLCDSAGLPPESKEVVLNAAKTTDEDTLQRSLDMLQNSNLKYALITDLISFAKLDSDYSEAEQKTIQQIAQYLGVSDKQFSLLGQVAEKATGPALQQEAEATETKQGFGSFPSLGGLGEKLNNAGINTNGLLQGLLTVAAPLILSRLISRRGSHMSRGGAGGMLGGLFGGGGGIGSIISMLNGGRGFGGAGNILGSLLRNRRR